MSTVIGSGIVVGSEIGFEIATQSAIYNQLKNAAALTSLIAGLYDDVPQVDNSGDPSAFPYVVVGEDIHVNIDTDLELMNQVSITVHSWSRVSGRKEIKFIQGAIKNALHRADLSHAGYKFITITEDTSQSFLDVDGHTRHGVQTFNLMIEKV